MKRIQNGNLAPLLLVVAFAGTSVAKEADIVPDALPALNEQSTLNDYLAYAALRNPGLEAAFNRWRAAAQRVPQARAWPDPRLNYGYYIRSVETRVGPQEQRFGASQTVPWFGKQRLRADVASEAASAAEQAYEGAKLRLFHEVKDAFYEYNYLRRAIAITEDNLRLLGRLEGVAQTRFRAGAPLTGVTQAQTELGKLDDRLRTLQALRPPLAARLNAALDRSTDEPLPWPRVTFSGPVNPSAEDLVRWLAEHNPELRGLALAIRQQEHAVRLARRESYPDFTVGVDYILTGESIVPGTPDSGKDAVIGTLSVNIPLGRKKYRAAVHEAQARREAAEQSRRERQNTLFAALRMTEYRFHDAERKIDLYRDTLVPQARGALSVAEESYETGRAGFLELIDAQRLLLEFELEYERARTRREQHLAELEMLVGRELTKLSE